MKCYLNILNGFKKKSKEMGEIEIYLQTPSFNVLYKLYFVFRRFGTCFVCSIIFKKLKFSKFSCLYLLIQEKRKNFLYYEKVLFKQIEQFVQ